MIIPHLGGKFLLTTPPDNTESMVFRPTSPAYNKPGRIVTLGHYYPQSQRDGAETLLRETRSAYDAGPSVNPRAMRQNLGWTKLIDALNADRQWPIKRLFELLNPLLEPDIAIAVVPPHLAYQAFWATRTLARQLAENGRVDATSCLVRHTTVKRITFGGPSTKELHRQTIQVENAELVMGRKVLLLDDIAKSGASLMACQTMLLEAGASMVQAMALGRVIIGGMEQG